MGKCALCNKKIKFARKCQALNEIICSTCCGTKKGAEIQCTNDCNYFVEGKIKEDRKEIIQLVKESFNNEFEDIFQDEDILELVGPFEQFVFQNYYNNKKVTDEFVTNCYIKIYYLIDGEKSIYTFDEIEKNIFDEFTKLAKETKMPIESQKLILVRMLKSVDSMTGGAYGNRMYLELLRFNFTGTGIVSEVTGNL